MKHAIVCLQIAKANIDPTNGLHTSDELKEILMSFNDSSSSLLANNNTAATNSINNNNNSKLLATAAAATALASLKGYYLMELFS